MTILIKRYPNRKLYDTVQKQYITLDEIADLIRQGEDVQVVDAASREDLTAMTLTQVILDQEKRRAGFFPKAILTGLVKAGGSPVDTFWRSLMKPLGLLALVDEEIERRLQALVGQGKLSQERVDEMSNWLTQVEPAFALENVIQKYLAVPTRRDYDALLAQLNELEARIDEIYSDPRR